MSNDYFKFKQFVVHHDRCAMKVGTDGVLLGAWARGGLRVLDVGTGTGLIAMMMAQRFPQAQIDGIDIDADACLQASGNVAQSPFCDRIAVHHVSLQQYVKGQDVDGMYDSIVSNPPFFARSLKAPDAKRTLARHADTLSFADLFRAVDRLLFADGHFSVVIPTDRKTDMEEEGYIFGFRLCRELQVKTVERKQPKRCLLDFVRNSDGMTETQTVVMQDADGSRSDWYATLTRDFYLE